MAWYRFYLLVSYMRLWLTIFLSSSILFCQFGKIDVKIDDRLLRNSEKQKVSSIKDEVSRFFSKHNWNEEYQNLKIPLHISIAFQGTAQKGGMETFHAQVLISDGMDLRYFDKSLQFYYNAGSSIYFDPVMFEPLGSFFAFYAYLILAGHMDTYDFYGGNLAYDQSREIMLRGISSDYPKGWSTRMQLLKEVTENKGLREARFAYYIAMDYFKQGKPDEALDEFKLMIEAMQVVFRQFPTGRTLYFLDAHRSDLVKALSIMGQKEILNQLAYMDQAHKDIYLKAIN
ncbi:MAG: hypothetical protein CMG70_04060 [Candidatus Marinimicrobia bacterium]|nr:hypothetical protein [Candidatus Neomarinimicrobiota bacterium]